MNKRHLAMVEVSNHLIIEMLTQGYKSNGFECVNGIPSDAVYVHSFTDEQRACTYFVFSHDSFPIVGLGGIIPIIDVTLEEYYPGDGT